MIPSIPQLLLLILVVFLVLVLPYLIFSPVARKSGFSKWWSLTMILPIVNVVVIWIFAFIEWPNERRS